jgi:hypothetical protein
VRERLELRADLVGCLAIAVTATILGFVLGLGVHATVTYILVLSLAQLLTTPVARASRRRRERHRSL